MAVLYINLSDEEHKAIEEAAAAEYQSMTQSQEMAKQEHCGLPA